MITETIDVVDAVDAALPVVRQHVQEIQERRRLPDAVVDALRATGINRMVLPRVLGGLETPTVDVLKVIEKISAVDGSTGWCVIIGAGSNIFAGYISEIGAREVFADPDWTSATMFAPLGTLEDDGGRLLLTGRWPFVSNSLHAEWIGLVAMLRRGNDVEPAPRLVFVRAADVTIEDTWDVVGMRGTGSHHVTVDHLAVDPGHCCVFVGDAWPDAPLWRMPVFSIILPMLAAVPLGIARGALDEIARQVREGGSGLKRGALADDPLAMADFSAADARLRAARAELFGLVDEAHRLVELGGRLDRQQLARIYLSHIQATETAVEVTGVAHRLGGGAAAYADNPLLRALCDVEAARQHFQFAHVHRIELGKALAGLDVSYPPYIT